MMSEDAEKLREVLQREPGRMLCMPCVGAITGLNIYEARKAVRELILYGEALVEEGHAGSLVEASLRFALTSEAASTVLLGYSSLEHLEYAAASVAKGPLSKDVVARLPALWARLADA